MKRRAEGIGEGARTGVFEFKRWLEATTYIDLPFNCYDNEYQCTLPLVHGEQTFDLDGSFLGSDTRPLSVECKTVDTESGQGPMFRRFLAEVYSSVQKDRQLKSGDARREYMWVTKHPFLITDWPKLTSHQHIKECIRENPDVFVDTKKNQFVEDDHIDDELVRVVADRIWLVVMNKKQSGLSLTTPELMSVWGLLQRKERIT